MSHEITSTDDLVLTGRPGWHGLGNVVENAPSPNEALKLAQMKLHMDTLMSTVDLGPPRFVNY